MTFGFPNSKKNSFRGNYMRKYGMPILIISPVQIIMRHPLRLEFGVAFSRYYILYLIKNEVFLKEVKLKQVYFLIEIVCILVSILELKLRSLMGSEKRIPNNSII